MSRSIQLTNDSGVYTALGEILRRSKWLYLYFAYQWDIYILISRTGSRNSTDVPAVSVATKLKVYVMILKKINIQSTLVICL